MALFKHKNGRVCEVLTEENIVLAKLMARKYFCNISDCIKLMLPPGTQSKDISNRVKEKTGNFVFLNKPKDEIEILIENRKIKSDKHIKVLRFLEKNDGIYISDLEQITEVNRSVFKTIEKNGYIKLVEKQIERNPFINKNIDKSSNINIINHINSSTLNLFIYTSYLNHY